MQGKNFSSGGRGARAAMGRRVFLAFAFLVATAVGARAQVFPAPETSPAALSPPSGVHMPDEPGATTSSLQSSLALPPPDTDPPDLPGPTPYALRGEDLSPSRFLPPLCLEDCLLALQWSLNKINANQEMKRLPAERAAEIEPVLRQVAEYIRIVDGRNSTLADYTWILVGTERVAADVEVDSDEFEPAEPPLRAINAVSFQAERGDVWLFRVRVIGEDNIVTDFRLDPPARLMAALPRREVFHLYFPTDLKRVEAHYGAVDRARAARNSPRVSLYAGQTRRREYLKESQYFLRMALRQLPEGDLDVCRDSLERAAKRIRHFERRRM